MAKKIFPVLLEEEELLALKLLAKEHHRSAGEMVRGWLHEWWEDFHPGQTYPKPEEKEAGNGDS